MPMRIIEKTFIEPALKATVAGAKWASAGFPMADGPELSARKELCRACENWNPNAFLGAGKCNVCGCSGLKLKLTRRVDFDGGSWLYNGIGVYIADVWKELMANLISAYIVAGITRKAFSIGK